MPSLEMSGPYDYDYDSIDAHVEQGMIGNYALGSKNSEGKFLVGYVGRSNSDLNAELKTYLGEKSYPLFKFSYASSEVDAYNKECKNYHDFEPDSQIHPAKPRQSRVVCPICHQ
jgi:hypothetical protein